MIGTDDAAEPPRLTDDLEKVGTGEAAERVRETDGNVKWSELVKLLSRPDYPMELR